METGWDVRYTSTHWQRQVLFQSWEVGHFGGKGTWGALGGNGGEPFIGEMRSCVQSEIDQIRKSGSVFHLGPAHSLILVHFAFAADEGIPFFFYTLL